MFSSPFSDEFGNKIVFMVRPTLNCTLFVEFSLEIHRSSALRGVLSPQIIDLKVGITLNKSLNYPKVMATIKIIKKDFYGRSVAPNLRHFFKCFMEI